MTHIVRQFTLVVSILLLFASNLLCQSAQQLPPHPSKEPIVKNRSKSTKSQTSGSEKQPESERKEDDHKAQPQAEPYPVQIVSQPRDSWYVAYVLITGFALIVGVGTLIAIWRQTAKLGEQVKEMIRAGQQTDRLIEQAIEQTKATDKTAEATNKSIDLLIGSERPWVIVTVRKDSQDTFPFTLVNCGRTPANILSARTYNVFVRDNESIPTQPLTMPHTDLSNFGIIAPKETSDQGTDLDKIRLVEDDLGKETFLHVRVGKMMFVRYIEIVYRNTLDQSLIHETKTCYYYDFMRARFLRMHLPGYTKQT